ncbi:MAG TPA: hypothetical protein PK812_01555, partial [Beijerinckiaceae bacterium]|nr:hypothetical protein [Beijerinckiaceae bacterium]
GPGVGVFIGLLLTHWFALGSRLLPQPGAIAAMALGTAALFLPWHSVRRQSDRIVEHLQSKARDALRATAPSPVWAIILVVGAWTVLLWRLAGLNPNYSDTIAPALWLTGELVAHPGTIQAEVYPHLQVLLPRLAAMLQKAFGLPVQALHDGLAAVFAMLGLGAVAMTAAKLSRTSGWVGLLAGCLAIAALVQAWPGKMHLGYGLLMHMPGYLLGAWALAAALAIWSWWLFSARSMRANVIAFGLAGLLFDLHSTFGVILLGTMLTGLGLEALSQRAFAVAIRSCVAGLAAFLVCASPQMVMLMLHALASPVAQGPIPDPAAWWTLMAARKPSHIFIWGENGVVQPLAWLAALWSLAVFAIWPLVASERRLRLVATGLAALVFSAMAYVAFAWRPTPTIAGLVLTRATLICVATLPALLAALLVLNVRAWSQSGNLASLGSAALAGLSLALISLPEAGPELRSLALVLLALAGLAARTLGPPRTPGAAVSLGRVVAMVACAVSLAVPLWLVPAKARETLASMPRPDGPEWSEVTRFLRERTEPAEMALLPPYPYAMMSSRKASPTDYGQLAFSVYARWLLPFEFNQLMVLYGIDLRDRPAHSVAAWLAEQGGLLCMIERGYVHLVSDAGRLQALRRHYPALRLIVAPKDGTEPEGWTCGPVKLPQLPLERAFENSRFVVYKLATG